MPVGHSNLQGESQRNKHIEYIFLPCSSAALGFLWAGPPPGGILRAIYMVHIICQVRKLEGERQRQIWRAKWKSPETELCQILPMSSQVIALVSFHSPYSHIKAHVACIVIIFYWSYQTMIPQCPQQTLALLYNTFSI